MKDPDDSVFNDEGSEQLRPPDWVIDLGADREIFDFETQELLDRIEKTLTSFGRRPPHPEAVLAEISPLVRQLHARGVSARAIADHSRVRPEAVRHILDQ